MATATVMAMVTKRAMGTATRVVGDKEGNGNGGKSNGDDKNDGVGRVMVMATKRVMVMVTATRVGEVGGRQNGH
jgi:hypothetical protein